MSDEQERAAAIREAGAILATHLCQLVITGGITTPMRVDHVCIRCPDTAAWPCDPCRDALTFLEGVLPPESLDPDPVDDPAAPETRCDQPKTPTARP